MLSESDLRELIGRDVLDREGKSIGNLETFFNDKETGVPEWVGVFTGTFRHHHFLGSGSRRRARWDRAPAAVDEGAGP